MRLIRIADVKRFSFIKILKNNGRNAKQLNHILIFKTEWEIVSILTHLIIIKWTFFNTNSTVQFLISKQLYTFKYQTSKCIKKKLDFFCNSWMKN